MNTFRVQKKTASHLSATVCVDSHAAVQPLKVDEITNDAVLCVLSKDGRVTSIVIRVGGLALSLALLVRWRATFTVRVSQGPAAFSV